MFLHLCLLQFANFMLNELEYAFIIKRGGNLFNSEIGISALYRDLTRGYKIFVFVLY
jgi:hypothetical protein